MLDPDVKHAYHPSEISGTGPVSGIRNDIICTGRCAIDFPSISVFWFWPYLMLSLGSSVLLVGCLMLRVAWREHMPAHYRLLGGIAVLAGLAILLCAGWLGIRGC